LQRRQVERVVGAISGASTAPPMQIAATIAEMTVTGERVKEYQMSLSRKRATAVAMSVPPLPAADAAAAGPPRSRAGRRSG
jgi:hypothetical protein